MASASTFFDFKPLDSTFLTPIPSSHTMGHTPWILHCFKTNCVTRAIKPLNNCTDKGQTYPLSTHQGKVVLVVNTASKCGFTPQLGSLQTLYTNLRSRYQPSEFELLAFPCNQFGGQEPGSDEQIQDFCLANYGVSFPVLGKTEVNGDKAEPVWEWMKTEMPGLMGMKRVKWNFEKFLVGRDGKVKGRWASTTKPETLEEVIVKEIESSKGQGKDGQAGQEAAAGSGEQAKV